MPLTTATKPMVSIPVKQRKRKNLLPFTVLHFNAFDRYLLCLVFLPRKDRPEKRLSRPLAKDKICVALQTLSRLDHLFFGVVRSP